MSPASKPREHVLASLRAGVAEGRPLLAAGVGSGLAAQAAEAGGADLVVVYNSGRFRSAGHGSLAGLMPYGNANDIVVGLVREVLAAVKAVPVVAGVCATDPFVDLDLFVRELRRLGVAGVQNFPTIGLFDRSFREDLEATGISFEREVELIRAAGRAGLLTCAFVTDEDAARRMALAGVDVLAPHLGVTRPQEEPGALRAAASSVRAIAEAAVGLRDDLVVLFHGGPIVDAEDVRQILELTPETHGFFAASSLERLPVFAAIESAARSFMGTRESEAVRRRAAPDFSTPPPALPVELSSVNLADYLRAHKLVGSSADVEVEELVGGLSNVVLRWRCDGLEGVVKQARPRLRVEEEWLLDVRRVLNERDAIATLGSRLPPGRVPVVTFTDEDTLVFGMTAVPTDAALWKPELLAGRLDLERARQAGALLRQIHDCTRDDPELALRFDARPLLDQSRLDPWYRAAARAHPDLEPVIEYAIERLVTVARVLVHGDFVPKNIFLVDDGLILLDYEVAHFGNPGYDVATFVNHMLLKGFGLPAHRSGFSAMAEAMWDAYGEGLPTEEVEFAEQEALLQLGALMLARVDGKSKVEYLVDHPGMQEARAFGRWLLRARPASLGAALRAYRTSESAGRL